MKTRLLLFAALVFFVIYPPKKSKAQTEQKAAKATLDSLKLQGQSDRDSSAMLTLKTDSLRLSNNSKWKTLDSLTKQIDSLIPKPPCRL